VLLELRPRRSVLYLPASNQRALEKARILPADCLILDLEDAVAPSAKAVARQQITEAIEQQYYNKCEVIVRINSLDTPWGHDDLKAMASLAIDGILIPKVNSASDVLAVIDLLDHHDKLATLPIWIMAETIQGIQNINNIAAAHKRVAAIVMGTSDLAKEMRVKHTLDRVGFLAPLTHCVMAARMNNLDIIDGVFLELNDLESFSYACKQGHSMGFDGKSLIHPKQIEEANKIFAPSAADVTHAHAVIEAWQKAEVEGIAVVVVNGKLVENLHYEEARRVLSLADAIVERNRG